MEKLFEIAGVYDEMKIAIISFQKNTNIIGAKYIHAYLQKNNYESFLILHQEAVSETNNAIIDFIHENKINIIGVSLMSHEFFQVSQFAKKIKSKFQNIPLIFGGIHATIAPEECLSICDIVIRGEGEHAFLELVQCIEQNRDFNDLPGICVKKEGNIILTSPRPLEENLDVFPFPKHLPNNMFVSHNGKILKMNRDLHRIYSRYRGTFCSIMTTRGCPFACSYCCNSAYKKLYNKSSVRKRTVESVISECIEEKNQHPNLLTINFQDDCFLANNKEWIYEFSIQYRDKIGIPFIVRTTPRHVTKEKIGMLKDGGLIWVVMGLQSGSERINKEIYKRNVSNKEFLNATDIIKSFNLYGGFDVILDNPYETEEESLETLKVILKIPKPFLFQLYSLCLYQGTEIHQKAIDDNFNFKDPRVKGYKKLSTTSLNQLIRMVPTYPKWLIKYLANHRKNKLGKMVIALCHIFNIVILEEINALKLLHQSYGSNLLKTLVLIKSFSKTVMYTFLRRVENT